MKCQTPKTLISIATSLVNPPAVDAKYFTSVTPPPSVCVCVQLHIATHFLLLFYLVTVIFSYRKFLGTPAP